MTTGNSDPSKASGESPFGLSSQVGGESWNYVSNAALVFSLLSTVLTGCVFGYLFGFVASIVWTTCASVFLVGLITLSMRMSRGDESATVPAIVCNVVLVALWMGNAIAFWQTGVPAAMVMGASGAWTWILHILLGGQRNRLVMAINMSMPAVALLYFLISSSWTDYPFWIALASTVSAVMMIMTLGQSAKISHENYQRQQSATGDAKAMRSKLEFAIESVGDGYFEVDLETMALTPNPKFTEALGFKAGQKDANDLRDFMHPDDAPAASANLAMCRDGLADGWNQDLRVRMPAGQYRWMTLRARILEASETSRRRLLIGSLVDLSGRKRLEAEMVAAKEAAVASARAKGEFLANMSHEIRTPLNGVLGMAQSLEASNLSEADREKVAVILDCGSSLMSLLNDVLDLSKIEAGKLEIVSVDEDFVQAMSRTRKLFQSQAEEKGLELTMMVDEAFPKRLRFDPVRVRQCVSNLLSNAIKFTAAGSVEVAMSARAMPDGGSLVSVRIMDTGIGMSEEAVGRLFGVFEQADSSTTRRFGGSGLGLFISRQLARMMGGDIVVESREGKGSTFTLTFMAQDSAAAQPTATEAPQAARARGSLRGVKVLLTDDNAINRQVIRLFLAPHGCEITEAANGEEALDKLSSQPFDIVLLDVHMPVMDGKEAVQRIRASSDSWSKLPVIALTADAMSGDRERYLALGMTDYVAKPVDQRELISKLSVCLGLSSQVAPGAKTGT
jgi:PAS domain S-box-containing protein